MHTVIANGDSVNVAEGSTVAQLLEQLEYEQEKIAVAVNGEFVPRSSYAQVRLCSSDCVDIVAPVQGG